MAALEDLVGRIGGDEFALWLNGGGRSAALERAARSSKSAACLSGYSENLAALLGISIGIALFEPESNEVVNELLAPGPVKGALTAISARENLGPRPSHGISESSDNAAIAQLLANPSAQIREDTLDQIVERAPEQPS